MNISGRVKKFISSLNRKTVSGPQSAFYLMDTGLLLWGGEGGGLKWWRRIS